MVCYMQVLTNRFVKIWGTSEAIASPEISRTDKNIAFKKKIMLQFKGKVLATSHCSFYYNQDFNIPWSGVMGNVLPKIALHLQACYVPNSPLCNLQHLQVPDLIRVWVPASLRLHWPTELYQDTSEEKYSCCPGASKKRTATRVAQPVPCLQDARKRSATFHCFWIFSELSWL